MSSARITVASAFIKQPSYVTSSSLSSRASFAYNNRSHRKNGSSYLYTYTDKFLYNVNNPRDLAPTSLVARRTFGTHVKPAERNSKPHFQTSSLLLSSTSAYLCPARNVHNDTNTKIISEKGTQNDESEYITDEYQKVYIAVGSNMGDRFENIMLALDNLRNTDSLQDDGTKNNSSRSSGNSNAGSRLVRKIRTSSLIDTPPMYITDQPSFLNGVFEMETKLSPHALLHRLKGIEQQIGRDLENGLRNGPRPVDLDVLFYGATTDDRNSRLEKEGEEVEGGDKINGGQILESSRLSIPHPRIGEREFVLAPLCDLDTNLIHPGLNITVGEMFHNLKTELYNDGQAPSSSSAVNVLPLPRERMIYFNETIIMGILNVTPDSFSDGGKYKGSSDLALDQALQMIEDGAGIIDIGGESTRPGAKEVEIGLELERTIPVIEHIRKTSDIPISIDTRHALVAKAAIEAGADIVNDVSGGTHDPRMLTTVADLSVPMILMHMRGTPETMQNMTDYKDVVAEVASSLRERSLAAEMAGIPRWLQVLDPGIGFAKTPEQSLSLMKHSNRMRDLVKDMPLLLGPSRKGFIGKILGGAKPEDRDFGTISACITALSGGNYVAPTILRVHNVKAVKDAIDVMHAVMSAE